MSKIKQLEKQIAELQAQLEEERAKVPDWDKMTNKEMVDLFKQSGWNSWQKCPVGSLMEGRVPQDAQLFELGHILGSALLGNWAQVVFTIRTIARMRLEELCPKWKGPIEEEGD